MDKLEVASRLSKAAGHLREHGWYQGNYWDLGYEMEDAPSCAVGSYLIANKIPFYDKPHYTLGVSLMSDQAIAAEDMLNELFKPVISEKLPEFNDHRATTAEMVIDLFEGMALQLEIEVLAEEEKKVADMSTLGVTIETC